MLTPCPVCEAPTTASVLAELGHCAACERDKDPELKAERELIALAKAEQAAVYEDQAREEQTRSENRGARELVQQEIARRELARRHLLPFVKRFNDAYDAGWVHKIICEELEAFERAVVAKESPRLILELPPRHGKSELVSRMFPAWFLGRNPKLEVIAASHTTSLAMDFSRKVRGVFRSDTFAPVFRDAHISPDSQAAEHWRTTHGGGYTAVGVGSAVVGKGAHCIRPDCNVHTDWYNSTAIRQIRVGDHVLGYDHAANRVVRTRVLAVSASQSDKGCTRIGDLDCTNDHRVFVPGRGYAPAATLGDSTPLLALAPDVRGVRRTLLAEVVGRAQATADAERPVLLGGVLDPEAQSSARRPGGFGVRRVRRAEGKSASGAVLAVLQRGAGVCRERVRRVFNAVQAAAERAGQSRAPRAPTGLLLAGVREAGADGAGSKSARRKLHPVPAVRQTNAPYPAQVLQQNVLFDVATRPPAHRSLRRWIQSRGFEVAQRASGLRPVWLRGAAQRSAPPGWRPDQQRPGEPDVALHALPQIVASHDGSSAASVAPSVWRGDYVVDIQTTTGNFFAGGVLVHNCLLIDDPVAGSEDAESFNAREAVKNWYQTEAYTRLAPGGGVMIIMQRWHDEDLAGWLQARARAGEGEQWRVVRFPAIAEHDEPYRKKGEPLHPSRYNLELLENIRRNMTMRQWEALYQQNPVPDDGAYFLKEFFRFYDPEDLPPADQLMVYSTWDLAIGQNEQNDYTAGFTAGLSQTDDLYILDHHHGRWNAMEMVEKVLDDQKRWNSQIVGLEKGHIQMTLGPFLSKRMAERRQMGFLLHPMAVGRRDKQSRARSIQGRMQQGRVLWPRKATWLAGAMRELMRFPNAQHDDRADALGHLGLLLDEMAPKRSPAPPKMKSWVDRLRHVTPTTARSSMSA